MYIYVHFFMTHISLSYLISKICMIIFNEIENEPIARA